MLNLRTKFRSTSPLAQVTKYFSASAFSSALAFGAIPILVAHLSPQDYAIVGLVQSAQPVMALILTAGVAQITGVYFFDARGPETKERLLSAIFTFLLISSALLLVLTAIGAITAAPAFRDGVLAAGILISARAHVLALEGFARAVGLAGKIALARVGRSAIFLVGSLYVVVMTDYGLFGVILSLTAAELFAVIVLDGGKFVAFQQSSRESLAVLPEVIRMSLPLTLHTGSMLLLVYADRWVIGRLLSLHDVGIYTLAYQVGGAVTLSVAALNEALWPRFLKEFEQRGTLGLQAAFKRFAPVYMLVGLVSGLGLSIVTVFYFMHLVPSAYKGGLFPALLIIVGMIFHSAYHPYVTVLLTLHKAGKIARLSCLAALFNLCANFSLVPIFGIVGSGIATLLSYGLLVFVFRYAANTLMPLEIGWKDVFRRLNVKRKVEVDD